MNKLTIYTNELLGMLSNYLSLKFGKKIQVKVEKNIEFGYWEETFPIIVFYYEEEIEMLGYQAIGKVKLSDTEVKEILNDMLKDKDYQVREIIYNAEIINSNHFYPQNQDNILFSGIEIILSENQKQLRKR